MLKNKRIEKNYRRNSSLKMVVAGVGGPAGVPIEIAHIASLSLNRYPATPRQQNLSLYAQFCTVSQAPKTYPP
jgi:hypothetical protein